MISVVVVGVRLVLCLEKYSHKYARYDDQQLCPRPKTERLSELK